MVRSIFSPIFPPSLCRLSFRYRLVQNDPDTFNTFTEKIEDAKARAAIKAQIEADKRERAEKAAREKALREGKSLPESSASSSSTPAAAARPGGGAAATTAGKDFKETRLQIRLASGGQPYTTTLSSDASESCFYSPSFCAAVTGKLARICSSADGGLFL